MAGRIGRVRGCLAAMDPIPPQRGIGKASVVFLTYCPALTASRLAPSPRGPLTPGPCLSALVYSLLLIVHCFLTTCHFFLQRDADHRGVFAGL